MIDLAAFRAADAAEAAAYASMFDAAPAALKAAWGLRTERVGDATLLLAPGVPTPMFNRVIGLGTFVPTTEALLDDVASRYRAEGVANFWVSVSEAAEPPALRGWLDSRGFALSSTCDVRLYEPAEHDDSPQSKYLPTSGSRA